ncbi:hypothetical protein [Reyranella sp.]|uniref:hypothetical protein n=1 Tax=Reyranella sp. TaxID=1929291 RepID=UPI003F7310AD
MAEGTTKSPESFLEQRKRYSEDFDKVVTPVWELYQHSVSAGMEYGKLTISYLFLTNAGGLAGLLALAPLMKEVNHLWLKGVIWVAVAFGIGLLFTAITAATSYANFTWNARLYAAKATDLENWLHVWHFSLDRTTTMAFSKENQARMTNAAKWSSRTTWTAVICGILAGLCSTIGGIGLALSLIKLGLV